MADDARCDDVKKTRPGPDVDTRADIEQDLALGQHIYDLRTEAGLDQRELAGHPRSASSRAQSGTQWYGLRG